VSPAGLETLRLTVPANPCKLVIVTLLVVEEAAGNETVGADILKSVIATGTLTELDRGPLVPVNVTA
jgi:hypothetical protein